MVCWLDSRPLHSYLVLSFFPFPLFKARINQWTFPDFIYLPLDYKQASGSAQCMSLILHCVLGRSCFLFPLFNCWTSCCVRQVCATFQFKLMSNDHALECIMYCFVCRNFNIFFWIIVMLMCTFVYLCQCTWVCGLYLLIYVSLFQCVWEEGRSQMIRECFLNQGKPFCPSGLTHTVYTYCAI